MIRVVGLDSESLIIHFRTHPFINGKNNARTITRTIRA